MTFRSDLEQKLGKIFSAIDLQDCKNIAKPFEDQGTFTKSKACNFTEQ